VRRLDATVSVEDGELREMKSKLTTVFFDPEGKPYKGTRREQLEQWARDSQDDSKHRIALDELFEGKVIVSTVWTGISGYPSLPEVWETAVFVGVVLCQMTKYTSQSDAKKGHDEIVTELKSLGQVEAIEKLQRDE